MKQFIDKLIERLEAESYWTENTFDEDGYSNDDSDEVVSLYNAKEIVNQLVEEHKDDIQTIDVSELLGEQGNDGWIPVEQMLPEESGEYYTYAYYGGHYMYSVDEIDCDGIIKEWNCSSDYQIIAWKPIAPYQPKGE